MSSSAPKWSRSPFHFHLRHRLPADCELGKGDAQRPYPATRPASGSWTEATSRRSGRRVKKSHRVAGARHGQCRAIGREGHGSARAAAVLRGTALARLDVPSRQVTVCGIGVPKTGRYHPAVRGKRDRECNRVRNTVRKDQFAREFRGQRSEVPQLDGRAFPVRCCRRRWRGTVILGLPVSASSSCTASGDAAANVLTWSGEKAIASIGRLSTTGMNQRD